MKAPSTASGESRGEDEQSEIRVLRIVAFWLIATLIVLLIGLWLEHQAELQPYRRSVIYEMFRSR